MTPFRALCFVFLLSLTAQAQTFKDLKPIPPALKELAPADRAELDAGIKKLAEEIVSLQTALKEKPDLQALLPDIQIYHNALRYPLQYNETIDLKAARAALADGLERARQLREGKVEWINVTGPRGYISRIDHSVQPYVLAVPAAYKPADKSTKYRFDFWCHGRGEDLTELKFIRSKELAYPDHFVVNLYGRFCCANKLAGEIDLLEALDDVKKRYPVDENRLVDIGFSMGGAAAWQFAVHYTDLFAAASPGAGFSESREFLHIPQAEVDAMQPWQKSLWHLYDCTDYAANLAMLPTIAYAGELDGQKQASDMMEKAMAAEGLKLERLIGPQTKHAYHKETRQQLDKRLEEITSKPRNLVPPKLTFTTWTLRYNKMFWITLQGLEKHWDRARVEAAIDNPTTITIKTTNVTALLVDIPAEPSPLTADSEITLTLDGTPLKTKSNRQKGLHAAFTKSNNTWKPATQDSNVVSPSNQALSTQDFPKDLQKRPGLQGPIDDAFLDSFIIVKPTAKPTNEKTAAWANAECQHAITQWQKQFRGEAIVKNDTDLTESDINNNNLILFGDPNSNTYINKIATKLPLQWTATDLTLANKKYDATTHMPALIYPNPLNPKRYIVLNSGFTFREQDYTNNARQTPKLPDYAIIDITTPVTPTAPGKIIDAGFFNESWQPQK